MKNLSRLLILSLSVVLFFACDEASGDLDDVLSGGEEALYSTADGAGKTSSGSDPGKGNDNQQIVAGQITAGEWKDLDHWDFWTSLGQKEEYKDTPEYWGFYLAKRISVFAKDESGKPIIDEEIKCLDKDGEVLFSSRTDQKGKAELWPGLIGANVNVDDLKLQIGGKAFGSLTLFEDGINELTVPGTFSQSTIPKIDIAFVVDATGSMADELEYLKVELINVIDSVKETNGSAKIMTGTVF